MKPLSDKERERRKIIPKAIEDYFGARIPQESFDRIHKAILAGEIHGLQGEEWRAYIKVRQNLEDPVYVAHIKTRFSGVA